MSDQQPKMRICAQKVAEVFDGDKTYKVPIFQRDYVWGKEQWEDLWNDANGGDEHYVGALVLQRKGDDSYEVIDGQQRLVTISLLAFAAVQVLKSNFEGSESEIEQLAEIFLVNEGRLGTRPRGKLILSGEENRGVWNVLLDNIPPGPSSHPMRKALDFFKNNFCEEQEDGGKIMFDESSAITNFVMNRVGRNLIFSVVIVDDEADAHVVFETLNGRGRALSPADLIKNYFLSKFIRPEERSECETRWREVAGKINPNERREVKRLPDFVRAIHNYRFGFARKNRLYRRIVKTIRNDFDVDDFLKNMEKQSEFYRELRHPNRDYWRDNYCRVDALTQRLQVQRCYPLLMCAWEKFGEEDFSEVLHICLAISVRRSVCNLSSRPLERVYHGAAHLVYEERLKSPREIFMHLKSCRVYPSDMDFGSEFQGTTRFDIDNNQQRRILQYLFVKLESAVGGREIEEDDLKKIEGDDTRRLGNYALWEHHHSLSANGMRDSYYRTTALTQCDQWTPNDVDTRQKNLADIALKVEDWRIDYPDARDDTEQ